MRNTKHREPTIVDIGFKPNRRGGWWYCEPNDRYSIQIVPANVFDKNRDERGRRLGIARPGGMKWGSLVFPAPEAAALHAARVVHDDQLRDRIVDAMQPNDNQHKARIQRALNLFMERQ